MSAFEDVYSPALFGQRAAMNAMNPLRNMLLLQREQRYDAAPRPRMPRQGRNALAAGAGQEPDYSAFTFDPRAHAMASQALAPYGLSPLSPEQVNPNAVLPNSGFFGNHPMLARGLEGAMFGAANTRGGETAGESISNIFQGMIGGMQERQGLVNRQFARPFEQAFALDKLRGLGLENQLHEAQIQHMRAETERLNNPMPTMVGVSDNDSGIISKYWDMGAGQWKTKVEPNPFFDPQKAQRNANLEFGSSFLGRLVNQRNDELTRAGKPPMTAQETMHFANQYAGGQAYSRGYGSSEGGNKAQENEIKNDQNIKYNEKREDWISKQKRSAWRDRGIDPKDQKAKQDYYDNHIAGQYAPKGSALPSNKPQPMGLSGLVQMMNASKQPSQHFAPEAPGFSLPSFFPSLYDTMPNPRTHMGRGPLPSNE